MVDLCPRHEWSGFRMVFEIRTNCVRFSNGLWPFYNRSGYRMVAKLDRFIYKKSHKNNFLLYKTVQLSQIFTIQKPDRISNGKNKMAAKMI